jgi:methylenetetrahydrofolate reductase (NADPH)
MPSGGTQHITGKSELAMKQEYTRALTHLTAWGQMPIIRFFLDSVRDGGVNNVLALRGDPPNKSSYPTRGVSAGSDLVAFIAKFNQIYVSRSRIRNPSRRSSAEDDFYFEAQSRCGADFIITQRFFDNDSILIL